MTESIALAQQVLCADGEPFRTLSLVGDLPAVTPQTSIADARRNYMRLAALIHPDKLRHTFSQSTEAFQCLVKAFECFADPKLRAKAAKYYALANKKATPRTRKAAAVAPSSSSSSSTPQTVVQPKAQRRAKTSRNGQAGKNKTAKDDFIVSDEEDDDDKDEEGDESDASGSDEVDDEEADDEWQAVAFGTRDDPEPLVSNARTPLGEPRTALPLYTATIIGCPHCRSRWEPDSRPQYSLFMGSWGKKVHCQLCLFVFGSATALHSCPHCETSFTYDASMYDSVIECRCCHRRLGFPYYPVNQRLIDTVVHEEWRLRRERARAAERELRARRRQHSLAAHSSAAVCESVNVMKSKRSGQRGSVRSASSASAGLTDADDRLTMLVGSCVVEETCPLCHQRVRSRHRSHVESCLQSASATGTTGKPISSSRAGGKKNTGRGRGRSRMAASTTVASGRAAAGRRSEGGKAKTTGRGAAAVVAATRKRRRRADSDSEDDGDDDDEESSCVASSSDEDDTVEEDSSDDDSGGSSDE